MAAKDRWLLPEGIEEILPDEARRLETMRRRILDLFFTWGYELVMPPLIEYLDSLLTGIGKDMDLQTFKVTDQLTGRMMGIRPDMTPQAARIDAHYLKRNAPVRLCYVGSVLRTRPDEFAGSREPLQMGAELFGYAAPEADAEILSLMLSTLQLIGIDKAHIDLAHVGICRGLAAQAGITGDQERELFEALQRKSRTEVEALLGMASATPVARKMLLALLDLNGDAEVLEQAQTLFQSAPPPVHAALDALKKVSVLVRRQLPQARLHFDLAELSGYRYYTGATFAAFVSGCGQAVAKGGRYDGIGKAFGRERAATGFGADLRQLLKISPVTDSGASGILAPDGDSETVTNEIAQLRARGERVVRRLPGATVSATDFKCDRELVQKDGRWVVQKI